MKSRDASRRGARSHRRTRATLAGFACICACAAAASDAVAANRGYEHVTPDDDGGYSVRWEGATPDGEHVYWHTDGSPTGVDPDGGSYASNLDGLSSDRTTAGGWVSRWLTPGGGVNNELMGTPPVIDVADDGDGMLWWTSVGHAPGDTDGTEDLYRATTSGMELLSGAPVAARLAAASSDLGVVAWFDTEQLLPTDTDTLPDVYARDAQGVIHQVSLASDGTDPGALQTDGPLSPANATSAGIVSDDGNRIFFRTGEGLVPTDTDGLQDVYVRIGFSETKRVTPQGGNPNNLVAVTDNGHYAFVKTVVPWEVADTNNRIDLYRIDVDSGAVVRITNEPGNLTSAQHGLYAWSKDGNHVVFPTRSVLDSADTDGGVSVYRWDNGTATYLCRVASPDELASFPFDWQGTRPVRMSADGSTVAFSTVRALTPDDLDANEDVYVHRNGALTRISQGPTGGDGAIDAKLGGVSFLDSTITVGRTLTADGSEVFFTTAESLVAADTNGRSDVYGWSPNDGLELISPGSGDHDAVYADNSADGQDVFFRTTEPLNGALGGAPLYFDARVRGGFNTPSPGGGSGTLGAPVAGGGSSGGPLPGLNPPSTTGETSGNDLPSQPPGDEPVVSGRVKVPAGPYGVRAARLALSLKIPSAGKLVVRVRGVRGGSRLAEGGVTRAFPAPTTAAVRVRLKPSMRRSLARNGRLQVVVLTTFTPTGGEPTTSRRRVVLRSSR